MSNFDSSSLQLPDNEVTLIYDSGADERISPEELRSLLDIPAGDRIQDYQELRTIGVGGVGAVFSAREPGLNREIALKILRPQFRGQTERIESFIHEARVTARIDHPNIVPVHRMGVFDDIGVYFTMKKIDGETLRAVLRKLEEDRPGYRRKYPLRRLLEIYLAACNGVAFSHRNGILHGDLKPGNIMVGDYGEVVVMDWGMASYHQELNRSYRTGAEKDLTPVTQVRDTHPEAEAEPDQARIAGTPPFMAPEQLTGETGATIQTDVYALGTILYTILTWRSAPFDVDLPRDELCQQVARGEFTPPHKKAPRGWVIPLELDAICLKAMARDRRQRYYTVNELIADIRNYLDGYPVAAYSPAPLYRLTKLVRRRPLIPATLLAALLTWLGFYLTLHFTNNARSTSLFNLAQHYYARGKEFNFLAERSYRVLLANPEPASERDRQLGREIHHQLSEMEMNFNSALEFIARSQEHGNHNEPTERMTADIFRSTLELYLNTREYAPLRRLLKQYRTRWGILFEPALRQNALLASLVAAIDADRGTLEIRLRDKTGWLVTIRNEKGPIQLPVSGVPAIDLPLEENSRFELPVGVYTLEFRRPDGSGFFHPAHVPLGAVIELEGGAPEPIPEGMCYIPGGKTGFLADTDRIDRIYDNNHLAPFLIGRYEVTLGEYLEFWLQLRDPELKKRYLAWLAFDPNSGKTQPVWSEKGELRPPFRRDLPVTGISPAAAKAYCEWLGKRLERKVRLPTLPEWEKAAFGDDGRRYAWGNTYRSGAANLREGLGASELAGAASGSFREDRSVFGVFDMTGNVREFALQPDGVSTVTLGGSFMTAPDEPRCNYNLDPARDLGFRCVIELPPEKNHD